MMPPNPYQEPEDSYGAQTLDHEAFLPEANGTSHQRQEDADDGRQPPSDGAYASLNEWAADQHARPDQPDGLLTISRDELARRLGYAFLSGMEAGGTPASHAPLSAPLSPPIPPLPDLSNVAPIPNSRPTDELPSGAENWIPLHHDNGEHPCRSVAMYVTQRPNPGEPGRLELLRIYDRRPSRPGEIPGPYEWRAPIPVDAPTCATCRRPIHPYTNADVNWNAVLRPFD